MKRQKLILYYVLFLVLTNTCNGQDSKNSISIFYTPQITRTYFEKTLDSVLKPFIEFHETTKNFRPITGHSYGLDYSYSFHKYHLGIYFQENLSGQRTGYAYNYRGAIPADTLSGYGGLYFHFKVRTFSLGLNFGKEIYSIPSYTSDIQLSVGLDIYEIAFLEDFIIQSKDGALGNGCCRIEFLTYPNHHFTNIYRRFEDGYYRADLAISWRNHFNLFGNCFLELNPQVRFLTKILKKSLALDVYVPDGVIWAIGLQTGISYHF